MGRLGCMGWSWWAPLGRWHGAKTGSRWGVSQQMERLWAWETVRLGVGGSRWRPPRSPDVPTLGVARVTAIKKKLPLRHIFCYSKIKPCLLSSGRFIYSWKSISSGFWSLIQINAGLIKSREEFFLIYLDYLFLSLFSHLLSIYLLFIRGLWLTRRIFSCCPKQFY